MGVQRTGRKGWVVRGKATVMDGVEGGLSSHTDAQTGECVNP